MGGRTLTAILSEPRSPNAADIPLSHVIRLLDTVDRSLLVSERSGRIVLANARARKCLDSVGLADYARLSLFTDILQVEAKRIFSAIEAGEQEVKLDLQRGEKRTKASVQWLADPDWLLIEFELPPPGAQTPPDPATQITVQELLQEREITYRNLLAAYLKLQEVNGQKTVFLASAAHELKTPLAVIKGYYDLLLSGSLGKLADKQREILHESKESCERLVRLVSMFLNYSALDRGKLVVHLHDNDIRDCLSELTKRWNEAFQRKNVKLEFRLDPGLPVFRFDYQKVQQAVANLLDNALKHTPAGGSVNLVAEPHFWERRASGDPQPQERRTQIMRHPDSARISVTDTGRGISAEHH